VTTDDDSMVPVQVRDLLDAVLSRLCTYREARVALLLECYATSKYIGECPCGINASRCEYHK
jgi:hypothetical protein